LRCFSESDLISLFDKMINTIRTEFFVFNPEAPHAGYVAHSYHPKSIYYRIGGFYIGTAPLLSGTLILYGCPIWLQPDLVSFRLGMPLFPTKVSNMLGEYLYQAFSTFIRLPVYWTLPGQM